MFAVFGHPIRSSLKIKCETTGLLKQLSLLCPLYDRDRRLSLPRQAVGDGLGLAVFRLAHLCGKVYY